MRPLFPEEGALKLLFTDTDSLVYAMRTDDMFAALSSQAHEFDFSNLPADHNSFSVLNKMTPGKMKDEIKGASMLEFVGFVACLQQHHIMMAKMGSIRSVNHQLYTIEQVKRRWPFTMTSDTSWMTVSPHCHTDIIIFCNFFIFFSMFICYC